MSGFFLRVKNEIIQSTMRNKSSDWYIFELSIDFPPFTNRGFNYSYLFLDDNLKEVNIRFKLNDEFDEFFFRLWFENENKYNHIIFKCKNHDFENATIELVFNKQIDDDFQNSLPKSKRGKIVPWYVSEKLERDSL